VVLDLVCWLVLPLTLGQLCRPWLAGWVGGHRRLVMVVDRCTILLLVYTSFCDSMLWGVWSGRGVGVVAATLIGCLVLFWLLFLVTNALGRACGFSTEDRITAVFCGSKKTLASGVPMAQLIFGAHPGLSFILLPILIYHPMQLLICGALAGRWAKRPD
jgi:sodium/bile acid cotransporter 7